MALTTHPPIITNALWDRLSPLLVEGSDSPKSNRGRPRRDSRQLMANVILKLKTGESWHNTEAGSSGHNLMKSLSKKGTWPAVWRLIVEHQTSLGLSTEELIAATNWQLDMNFISGTIEEWLGHDAAAIDRAYKEKPKYSSKRPSPPSGPRRDIIYSTPDSLWALVRPIIDRLHPRKEKGRKRIPARLMLDAIIHHARGGYQWSLVPRNFAHYSTVHKRLSLWQELGIFDEIFRTVVSHADELGLVDWSMQAIDGSLCKAKRRGEATGDNPTDRSKGGSKRSLIVDRNGYPLAIMVGGANIPDLSLVKETMERLPRPKSKVEKMVMIADRGYRGANTKVEIESHGYVLRTPPRDRDDPYGILDTPLTKEERRVRAQVERCHSWFNNYRSVAIRQSRKKDCYQAILSLSGALIWWGRISATQG